MIQRSGYLTISYLIFISAVFTLLLNTGFVSAQDSRFKVEPYTEVLLGSTQYLLQAPGVQSKLEFPLNSLVLGVGAEYSVQRREMEEWRFKLSAGTAISGPWGLLKDHDWYLVEDAPPIKFSYTESEAEMFLFEVDAGGEKRLHSSGEAHYFASLQYSYQYISQNALGYSGWQYVQDPNPPVDDDYVYAIGVMNSDLLALEYTVVYHRLGAGGVLRWQPYPRLGIDLTLLPQLTYVRDKDDHVLRNKLSTAAGIGYGGAAELSITYRSPGTQEYQSYVGLTGNLLYLRAVTEQTQEWYGDDPGTSEDDTGQKYTGISHIIQTLQGGLSLSAGVWYQ